MARVRVAIRFARMIILSGLVNLLLVSAAWLGVVPPELPSGGSVSTRGAPGGGGGQQSHAWVVLPDPNPKNEEAAMLAHVAPRSAGAGGVGAADGVLFPAVRLEKMAIGIAACDDRVFMFFEPEEGRDAGSLEVLSVRALATPIAGMYAYEPRGRLEAHRSVRRMGGFVGSVGTSEGPLVVVREDPAVGVDRLVISLLEGGEWREVRSPDGIDLGARVSVASVGGQAWIVGRRGDGIWGVWVGKDLDSWEQQRSGATWGFRSLAGAPFEVGSARLAGVGALAVAAVREGAGLTLWSEVGSEWAKFGEHASVGDGWGLAGLEDVGRVVVIWEDQAAGPGVESTGAHVGPVGVKVWEVSAGTGLVLHDGEAARRGPLSTQDFRALVVLLVGATTAVLLFVVRVGEDGGVLSLPPGVSLAAAGRRVAASAFDVAIALAGVWVVTGATPPEVLDVLKLTPGGMGVMGLVDVVVFGFVGGTVCEGVFGRTIGKVVAGCEVLPVAGRETVDRRGLGLGRAAIRNAVKWALPPAALLGLFEPGGRHRGDVAGRTVVVERFEPEEGVGV